MNPAMDRHDRPGHADHAGHRGNYLTRARVSEASPELIALLARAVTDCGHVPACPGMQRIDFEAIDPAPAELTDPDLASALTIMPPGAAPDEIARANAAHRIRHPGSPPVAYIPAEMAAELEAEHGHHCARNWRRAHWGTPESSLWARLEIPGDDRAMMTLLTAEAAPKGLLRTLGMLGAKVVGDFRARTSAERATAADDPGVTVFGYGPGLWSDPEAIREMHENAFPRDD